MRPDTTPLPLNVFRANAGALIIDAEGRVLAFERCHFKGAWQMPQGGLKENEEPLAAALREVFEETGLAADDLELIADYPEWLAYELPQERRSAKHGRGQVQKWFLFRLASSVDHLCLDRQDEPEFCSWKWTTLQDIIDTTAPFRQSIYKKLAIGFARYLKQP